MTQNTFRLVTGLRLGLFLALAAGIIGGTAMEAWACGGAYNYPNNTRPSDGNDAMSREPIDLFNGSVTETATDATLPGVTMDWSHTRQYSSVHSNGPFIQGWGWVASPITDFVCQDTSTNLVGGSSTSENIALYRNGTKTAVFLKKAINTVPSKYMAPLNYQATLAYVQDGGEYVFTLTYTRTGERYIFHGLNIADTAKRGLLKRKRDRYGTEISYGYSTGAYGGRITTVTTSQGWQISYYYISSGANTGNIDYFDVKNLSGQVLQRVRYTYSVAGVGYSTDLGSDGNLIMVQAFVRGTADNLANSDDSDFSIKKITMYRYFGHSLKMVLSPESVAKAMADGNKTASELLSLADTDVVAGTTQMKDYANVSYTYYNSNYSTADVHTADGGVGGDENLNDKYGGTDCNETGFARTQTVHKDYRGFLGTRTYFYMNKYADDENITRNAVIRIVVEDEGASGNRRIYGVNTNKKLLREVTVQSPASNPQYWCKSFVRGELTMIPGYTMEITDPGFPGSTINELNDSCTNYTLEIWPLSTPGEGAATVVPDWYYRIVVPTQWHSNETTDLVTAMRMPSAHSCVNNDNKVALLLSASTSSNWNNNDILNDASGAIHTYSYLHVTPLNVNCRVEDEKHAGGGPACYVAATDYGDGSSNAPEYLPIATRTYPVATTSRTDATCLTTTYTYTFYDSADVAQQLKTRTITYPTVSTGENGSGAAVTVSEYYDTVGRLRWTQDGEGRVSYFSYHPDTGGLAYRMDDVKTDSLPSDITSGSSGKWLAWSGTVPFSQTSSTCLQIVTKWEYDDLGRLIKSQDAEGAVACVTYGNNQTVVYPGWDTTNSVAALPVRVTKTNNDDLTTDVYSLNPGSLTYSTTNGLPTAITAGNSQSNYIAWKRHSYNSTTALLEKTDIYHNIPTSGDGTLSTDYYRTFYLSDSLGRRTHTIQVVSGTDATGLTGCVEQVTKVDYDANDRAVAFYSGVSDASHVMKTTSLYDTDPTTLVKVAAMYYDEATPGSGTSGVGDGLITSTLSYYDAANIDANHAKKTNYRYNWRGQLRGIEPAAAPYTVFDVDNMGRTVAAATYQANVTWASVMATADYAATTAADGSAYRGSLAKTYYDKMGRVYRTEAYGVTASTGAAGDKMVVDCFYDRNSRLVGLVSPARGGVEYAFDGIGRVSEVRQVTDLASTKYTSGAFNYCSPLPGASTGGDNGVLQIARVAYDKVGNVTESLTMEANHDDTNGLNLGSSPKDFIQTAMFSWYDPVHRLTNSAAYGTNTATWSYADKPTRGTNSPSSSDTVLVTNYAYESATGRLSTATDPKGIVGKKLYDALGRTRFTVDNYVDFALSGTTPTNTNGGTSQDQDRVTQYDYNGLSRITAMTALDPDSATSNDDQRTRYLYEDSQNASLVTNVIYPDSADTSSSGSDQVKLAYWLDGQLKSRTSQANSGETATLLEYEYDSLRRLAKQKVTTPGTGVDTTVRAIAYTYDNLGRRDKITSYSDTAATTAVNDVAYAYNDFGALATEYQEHAGAKSANSLYVGYNYDLAATGGALTKGLRFKSLRYPNSRLVHNTYGQTDSLADKLSRLDAIKDDNGGTPNNTLASYQLSGAGRLIAENFDQPQVKLNYAGTTSGSYTGFDRFGRVTQQSWRYSGTTPADLDKFSYAYDRNSNRSYRKNNLTGGKDELYTYDGLNRLQVMSRGTVSSSGNPPVYSIGNENRHEVFRRLGAGQLSEYEILNFGGEGNPWLWDMYPRYNKANEITYMELLYGQMQLPLYDARGNIIFSPKGGDEATGLHLKYDAWNRLTAVYGDSAGQPGSLIATYKYDGLGRRVSKAIAGGDTYDDYYNAAWQLIEQRKTPSGGSSSVYVQYVWSARYIDAPVCRFRDADGNAGNGLEECVYYLTDANMNVTALANSSGNVVERYVYDSFGQASIYDNTWTNTRSTSSYGNDVLFAGYRLDSETGLYHVRNRMYHPMLGWMQRDPLQYIDGMNMYEYCRSCPTILVDPSGKSWWGFVADIVAGVAGGVYVGALVGGATALIVPAAIVAIGALAIGVIDVIIDMKNAPDAAQPLRPYYEKTLPGQIKQTEDDMFGPKDPGTEKPNCPVPQK
jgi:RHS repeat-associated protein